MTPEDENKFDFSWRVIRFSVQPVGEDCPVDCGDDGVTQRSTSAASEGELTLQTWKKKNQLNWFLFRQQVFQTGAVVWLFKPETKLVIMISLLLLFLYVRVKTNETYLNRD